MEIYFGYVNCNECFCGSCATPKHYLVECSEITGAEFAIKEVDSSYKSHNPMEYVLSEEECRRLGVHSRIDGVNFTEEGKL